MHLLIHLSVKVLGVQGDDVPGQQFLDGSIFPLPGSIDKDLGAQHSYAAVGFGERLAAKH